MKRTGNTLRYLGMVFLALSLLMPMSLGTAAAEETSTEAQSTGQGSGDENLERNQDENPDGDNDDEEPVDPASPVVVTTLNPILIPAENCGELGEIEFPSVEGVEYYIQHIFPRKVALVAVEVLEGYQLSEESSTLFEIDLKGEPCPDASGDPGNPAEPTDPADPADPADPSDGSAGGDATSGTSGSETGTAVTALPSTGSGTTPGTNGQWLLLAAAAGLMTAALGVRRRYQA